MFGTRCIIIGRTAADIDDEMRVDVLDLGIDVVAEILHPFVLQPDTVEHSLWRFCHAWIVVAFSMMECGAFDDDGSYVFEVDEVGIFHSISERARSGHDGVLELEFTYIDIEISHVFD